MSLEILDSPGIRALLAVAGDLARKARAKRAEARAAPRDDSSYRAALRDLATGYLHAARLLLSEARERCEHDEWEEIWHECEADERPVGMNPFTDAIRYETSYSHRGEEKCAACGLRREFDERGCWHQSARASAAEDAADAKREREWERRYDGE